MGNTRGSEDSIPNISAGQPINVNKNTNSGVGNDVETIVGNLQSRAGLSIIDNNNTLTNSPKILQ